MIQTVLEYKNAQKITWLELSERFGSKHYQEAQSWSAWGWLVITEDNKEEFLVSVKRVRCRA